MSQMHGVRLGGSTPGVKMPTKIIPEVNDRQAQDGAFSPSSAVPGTFRESTVPQMQASISPRGLRKQGIVERKPGDLVEEDGLLQI